MTILIVDDERDFRESLKELFEDDGFQVSTAKNGAEALSTLKADTPPCLVILDLLMPQVCGDMVYEEMQKDPRLAGIPVIICTSDPARAPSGVMIMKKPISVDRLLEAVELHCPRP